MNGGDIRLIGLLLVSNIRIDFSFIFGKLSVARKLNLNGGAITPTGLLFRNPVGTLPMCQKFLH